MSRLLRVNGALALGTLVLLALQWRSLLLIPDSTGAWLFLGTIVVMTLFDSELPNGDLVDMSTPLVAAATVATGVAGASVAVVAVIASRGLVLILRRGRAVQASRVLDALFRSVFAVAAVGELTQVTAPIVTRIAAGNASELALGTAVPVAVFFALSFGAAQIQSSVREVRPLSVLLAGNIRLQGWMLAAQVSVAILSILVATRMSPWGLAIVVLLLLVVRQSFTLLVDVRTAYRDTVSLLARAMEAENPERLAHAERVAALASAIGREVGLQGQRLEWLTYAALFHDMDLLGTDDVLTVQQMRLDPVVSTPSVGVVGEVKFLEPIARILSIVSVGGETTTSHDEFDIIAAYIVSRASEIDDVVRRRPVDTRKSDGVGRRLYAERRRELDSKIGRSASRLAAISAATIPPSEAR
jgi:hypothetical protein